jgi:hypothetical protein
LFGIFDKAAKAKADAKKRADSWWKAQKLLGIDPDIRDCTLCKARINRPGGYLFGMKDVLGSEKFMTHHIGLLEKKGIPSDKAQEMVWQEVEKMSHDLNKAELLVCDKCIRFFA